MDVVGHEAVRMQPGIESRNHFGDQIRQDLSVMSCVEDVLPVIATQGDVVQRTRHMQAQWSRHPCLR